MNQPPIGIWVTYAYDSLHLHSCTHVHNMTLTYTIDTNCHRSYSSYCNEYLFDTATSKQQVYMHKLSSNWARPDQITKSPKDKSHSCQLSIYLHTICNQLALCNTTTWSGIQIACNLQSTCSLQYSNFNWHSICLQFNWWLLLLPVTVLYLYRVILGSRNHRFWPSLRVSKHTLMKSATQPASVVSINHEETATPASEFLQTPSEDCFYYCS